MSEGLASSKAAKRAEAGSAENLMDGFGDVRVRVLALAIYAAAAEASCADEEGDACAEHLGLVRPEADAMTASGLRTRSYPKRAREQLPAR